MLRYLIKPDIDLDAGVLDSIVKPFYWLLIYTGLYLSLKIIPYFMFLSDELDALFYVGGVLLVALLLSKILRVFINRWLRVRKRFSKTPEVLYKIVSLIVYLLAFLMVLAYFEVEITPLIATLGLGGLAVGLALQQTLSDFSRAFI
ncbi:MAG: hypothetical protein B6U97_00970 [Candidatus Altiarchaeales archaeon ex4484_96]|nr:MAG: hypothetical protein B6U97_00970 [Candidatus Altiarchaeales archaeon ex4484_96]